MTSYLVCFICAVIGLIIGAVVVHFNGRLDREELYGLRTEVCDKTRTIGELELLVTSWAYSETLDDALESIARLISKAAEEREVLRAKAASSTDDFHNAGSIANQMAVAFFSENDRRALDEIEVRTERLLRIFWTRHDYAVEKGLIKKPFPSWRNFLLTREERAKLIAQ